MIAKLIKRDLKKMFRFSVYFYIAGIILSVLLLCFGKNIEVSGFMFSMRYYLYVLLIFIPYICIIPAIMVNAFIQIGLTFRNSFYKDESYLTHTLPVTRFQLLLSKILSACIVIVSSLVVCFVCRIFSEICFYQMYGYFMISLDRLDFDLSMVVYFIIMFICVLFDLISIILVLFNAIIEGYTSNHKRGKKSFLWFVLYFISYCLIKTAMVILSILCTGKVKVFDPDGLDLREVLFFSGSYTNDSMLPPVVFYTIFITVIISNIICTGILLYNAKRKFDKGVNVD